MSEENSHVNLEKWRIRLIPFARLLDTLAPGPENQALIWNQ